MIPRANHVAGSGPLPYADTSHAVSVPSSTSSTRRIQSRPSGLHMPRPNRSPKPENDQNVGHPRTIVDPIASHVIGRPPTETRDPRPGSQDHSISMIMII